ncbi:MAG: hypothetical protein LBQ84_04985 [Flavobacteriaceae bacterium]|jgi:hypothetical protein|nr:hypothetical protein [Flavobacteriaceae bacterium]
MDVLDIFVGYTFDIISTLLVYIFKYKTKVSFNEVWKTEKRLVRNITYIQIGVLILIILLLYATHL